MRANGEYGRGQMLAVNAKPIARSGVGALAPNSEFVAQPEQSVPFRYRHVRRDT